MKAFRLVTEAQPLENEQARAARLAAVEVDVFTPDRFYVDAVVDRAVTPRKAPGKIAAHG